MQQEYLNLIQKENSREKKESKNERKRISNRDFIGPSSISLETQNIVPLQEDANIPNINSPYTVTDRPTNNGGALSSRKNRWSAPGARETFP